MTLPDLQDIFEITFNRNLQQAKFHSKIKHNYTTQVKVKVNILPIQSRTGQQVSFEIKLEIYESLFLKQT